MKKTLKTKYKFIIPIFLFDFVGTYRLCRDDKTFSLNDVAASRPSYKMIYIIYPSQNPTPIPFPCKL